MRELLYRKIYLSIRDDIEKGRLSPGVRLDGVRELAGHWNTSANTILKALDILESEGFIRKTQGQGIFVQDSHAVKNTAVPGGDHTGPVSAAGPLELVLYDLNVPINSMIIAAVETTAANFGYSLRVKAGRETDDFASSDIPRIVVPAMAESIPDSVKGNEPVIYIGDFSPPPYFAHSYAVADTYAGFYSAAELLFTSGRERIAYIGSSERLEDEAGWNACRDLLSGTRLGFRRAYAVSAGGWDPEQGRLAMEKLLLNEEFPDGVICCSDSLAAGVLRACRDAGLSVPDDAAVIGAGSQEIAPLLDPPLTSLKLPVFSISYFAVSYIDGCRRGIINEPCRLRADMDLVLRETSPASEDQGLWF